MELSRTDILIAGGGVAGLAAAAAFGTAGFSVTVVDPAPPVTDAASEGADLRTTAFLQPARDLLASAGLWDRLATHAMPLDVMRIVDASGPDGAVRATRDFVAADLGGLPFGWNLPNWLLRREMVARLAELPNVTFRPGTGFAGMVTRSGEARVTLSDGARLAAKLVVAADGRDSAVRRVLGIGVRTFRYGQKAVTCAVTHEAPHGNVSTEVHRAGGPVTLVPLPDLNGRPCSSVVWMTDGAEAQRLAALPDEAFAAAATDRSAGVAGPLTLASRRQVWPITARLAERITGQRSALIAEAAHVVPPIGAQGLNMSLADIAALRDLAVARPESLGDARMLDRWEKTRMPDMRMRVLGIDALNRASQLGAPPLTALRALGLTALHDLAPLRRAAMSLGLGARGGDQSTLSTTEVSRAKVPSTS